jgi:hypothetical protein
LALILPRSDRIATIASGVVGQLAATIHAAVPDAFIAINHAEVHRQNRPSSVRAAQPLDPASPI